MQRGMEVVDIATARRGLVVESNHGNVTVRFRRSNGGFHRPETLPSVQIMELMEYDEVTDGKDHVERAALLARRVYQQQIQRLADATGLSFPEAKNILEGVIGG